MDQNIDDTMTTGRSVKDLAKMLEHSIFLGPPSSNPMQNRLKAIETMSSKNKNAAKASLNDFFKTMGKSNQNIPKKPSPKELWRPNGNQKVDSGRVRQSMDTLLRILKLGMEFHVEFVKEAQSEKGKVFKIRGTFHSKLKSDAFIFNRIDEFWTSFKSIISSTFPQQKTFTSLLGTVLIGLVEAHQVSMDIIEYGRSVGESSKTILKCKVMQNITQTIQDLEKELDCVLYFVGNCIASETTARECKTISLGNTADLASGIQQYHGVEFEDEASPKPIITLPAIVEAPLLWMRQRTGFGDGEEDQILMSSLFKIETQTKAFYKHGYDDIVLLLFIAETIGKVANEVNCDSQLRKRLYPGLSQVFAVSRANCLALLKQQYKVDLSQ